MEQLRLLALHPTDRWEATGKVTYAFNDNNKIWGSYAYQTEVDNHPLSVWWAPEWTIPYPGKPVARKRPTFTCQLHPRVQRHHHQRIRLPYSKFINDDSQGSPNASLRSTVGFPSGSLFAPQCQPADSQFKQADGIPG